jgi:gamma-glutamyltranspeptidase/glutathione hydrolase
VGKGVDTKLQTHRLVEGIKFAYGQRAELGDPDFVDELNTFQREMVRDETAAKVRAKVRDDAVLANVSDYDPQGLVNPTPQVPVRPRGVCEMSR